MDSSAEVLVLLSIHSVLLLQWGSGLDIGNEGRLCSCCNLSGEVALSCTAQHSQEHRGRKYRDFFELAGGEEKQEILFGERCRALFQQKDLEPEPQPKELS